MIEVSIIVPIYNKEKHLKRCIDSILNQTLKNIEIILVNDGSTDNSLEICKNYARTDSRIKIINKKNEGVSKARNDGILASSGSYVGFVDADDYIDENMYRSMLMKCKSFNSEVCISNYYIENNNHLNPVKLDIHSDLVSKEDILDTFILDMISSDPDIENSKAIMGSSWRFLISRHFLINNNILFPENIPLREDLLFVLDMMVKAESICIEHSYNYFYVNTDDSALKKFRSNYFEMGLDVNNRIDQTLAGYDNNKSVKQRLNYNYLDLFISSIVNEASRNSPYTLKQKIKRIKEICNHDKTEEVISEISAKKLSKKKKIAYFAIKHSKSLFLLAVYSFR